MSAFLAYLAWIVWRDSQSEEAVWVGAAILLVAVFVVALTTWRLRTGRTPLIVERSGRVYRAYPSVTNAPRMAPAATPLIDPAVNQPHARARGIGAWI